jgi:hypothetical protein
MLFVKTNKKVYEYNGGREKEEEEEGKGKRRKVKK